ncbi:MAG: (2Fe-2S) ferredoxin domain-containing protein [Magnetococcales bacterium]|nr:(2Fe-2S) ferredoxin domain-containing protein [Magnetococcales bacterium]
MKPKHHVFVCMNQRPEGHPKGSCKALGSHQVIDAFYGELEKRGLFESILVTAAGCMGPCMQGPTVVVYPEGVWYGKVKPADVAEIFDTHLVPDEGAPLDRLRIL